MNPGVHNELPECLTPDELYAYFAGELDVDYKIGIEEHLASCEWCRLLSEDIADFTIEEVKHQTRYAENVEREPSPVSSVAGRMEIVAADVLGSPTGPVELSQELTMNAPLPKRPRFMEAFVDFVIELAYERFPDDASSIGDGAIRALVMGGVAFASPAAGYNRMDVSGSTLIITSVVALAKATYDLLSKHRGHAESEVIALVTHNLKGATGDGLPGAIDDQTIQLVVRRTIEYTHSHP
jgi:putative zinc finger protein